MRAIELIQELKSAIKQLEAMDTDKDIKVFHSVRTGQYGGDHVEIDQFGLEFNLFDEDEDNVITMDYEVCEI